MSFLLSLIYVSYVFLGIAFSIQIGKAHQSSSTLQLLAFIASVTATLCQYWRWVPCGPVYSVYCVSLASLDSCIGKDGNSQLIFYSFNFIFIFICSAISLKNDAANKSRSASTTIHNLCCKPAFPGPSITQRWLIFLLGTFELLSTGPHYTGPHYLGLS